MPSLIDTLSSLSNHSAQITRLANHNNRPCGPFTEACLNSASLLSLIRDADDSEVRLFKFIGEAEGGKGKTVEKRDGTIVTPLKDMKRARQGTEGTKEGDEVDILLRTALRLVDDYHSAPRRRAHIAGLLEQHHKQLQRVAKLEAAITEAQEAVSAPRISSTVPSTTQPSLRKARPPSDPESVIRAEEASLKALEATLLPLRRAAQSRQQKTPSPTLPSPAPLAQTYPMQTPAKTPIPHVTNALVNGMTPRRTVPRAMDRFSPLKLLVTPRVKAGQSGLRKVVRNEEVFGSTAPAVESEDDAQEETETRQMDDEDETTIRIPRHLEDSAPEEPAEVPSANESLSESTPIDPSVPVESGPLRVEGVEVENNSVKDGVRKISEHHGEMMRQNVKDQPMQSDPSSTVSHLYRLSTSDPSPSLPPSSASISSTSTLSSPPIPVPPITSHTILSAHLFLLLLRSENVSASMNDIRDRLTSVAKARDWADVESLVKNTIYGVVGKRTVRLDRRAPGGGTMSFAI